MYICYRYVRHMDGLVDLLYGWLLVGWSCLLSTALSSLWCSAALAVQLLQQLLQSGLQLLLLLCILLLLSQLVTVQPLQGRV